MPISESAIRGQLLRRGYRLHKSRTRNEDHPAFGCYMIIDADNNWAVQGSGPFGPNMDLEDVTEWTADLVRNW